MTAIDPGSASGPRGGMALASRIAKKLSDVAADSRQAPAVRSAARGALEALGVSRAKTIADVVAEAESTVDDALATTPAKVRAIEVLEKVLRRMARR